MLQVVGKSQQYKQALEAAKSIISEIKNGNLTFVGHSLGGGMAENNSIKTGYSAISFNPAGVSPRTSGTIARSNNTDVYIMTTDPLNFFQSGTSLPKTKGNITYLQPRSAKGLFDGHSIDLSLIHI